MAEDVAPKLYEKIMESFDRKVSSSAKIEKFNKLLEKEKATAADVSKYAADLGDIAVETLREILTEDVLPNGRMYYNIADRTIKPLIRKAYDMVMEAADQQQRIDDKAAGIGMNPVIPSFPDKKIEDLMFKLAAIFDEEADE